MGGGAGRGGGERSIFEALISSHGRRKSYCTTPGVGIGISGGVSKKFNVKVFYVMGKALSGELSCPCDSSCFWCCCPRC